MPTGRDVFLGLWRASVFALLLFWIPVAGPLAAGFVGGRRVGTVGAAVAASVLPAVVSGGMVATFLLAVEDLGALFAPLFPGPFGLWIAVQTLVVPVGAALGGATADRRVFRQATI